MADYPDWIRAFNLVSTSITIPINIETSDVILPITIVGATATVDVNLAAQVANIDFNFADQSIAVFDAAKWFAHQAQQVFVYGIKSIGDDSSDVVCSRLVLSGEVFFVGGIGWSLRGTQTPSSMYASLKVGGATAVEIGSERGRGVILDVPVRATEGQTVELYISNFGADAALDAGGTIWGYIEEA